MINITCSIVKIALWELIARRNMTKLRHCDVNQAKGYGISRFNTRKEGLDSIAKSALLLTLSTGALCYIRVHLILMSISSERDCQCVS